jgi:hypothetical protein
MRQRVFRDMLTREAGPGADAPAIAAAGRRLCEHFARRFTPLIGDAGVDAIFARSLNLAAPNVRTLAAGPASDTRAEPFALLQLSLEQQPPAAAIETVVDVLATAGDLLASFIGDGLTTRLLREAWPDDFAADTTEETT